MHLPAWDPQTQEDEECFFTPCPCLQWCQVYAMETPPVYDTYKNYYLEGKKV